MSGDTIVGSSTPGAILLDSDDDWRPRLYSLFSDFPAPYTGTYYLAVIAWDPAATGGYQAFPRAPRRPPPGQRRLRRRARAPLQGGQPGRDDARRGQRLHPDRFRFGAGCTGLRGERRGCRLPADARPDGGARRWTTPPRTTGRSTCWKLRLPGRTPPAWPARTTPSPGIPSTWTIRTTSAVNQTLYLICDNYGTGAAGSFVLSGHMSCPPVPVQATTWGSLKAIYKN